MVSTRWEQGRDEGIAHDTPADVIKSDLNYGSCIGKALGGGGAFMAASFGIWMERIIKAAGWGGRQMGNISCRLDGAVGAYSSPLNTVGGYAMTSECTTSKDVSLQPHPCELYTNSRDAQLRALTSYTRAAIAQMHLQNWQHDRPRTGSTFPFLQLRLVATRANPLSIPNMKSCRLCM